MNYSIIIIEDDTFIRQMYSTKISELDIKVISVSEIPDLKKNLEKNNISLILLDIILPKINGFDILIWLKKHKEFQDIPVIVLSNLSSQTDIDKAFELGAVDYIVKSNYTPFEVMRTIQKHLPSK
jgi:DNA-binding response OmpR family regulator